MRSYLVAAQPLRALMVTSVEGKGWQSGLLAKRRVSNHEGARLNHEAGHIG